MQIALQIERHFRLFRPLVIQRVMIHNESPKVGLSQIFLLANPEKIVYSHHD
jgi:hypothetical protein